MSLYKKLIIYLFIFLSSQLTSAQYLTKRQVEWAKIESAVPDTIKLKYISKLIGNEFADDKYPSDYREFESGNFSKQLTKFHLLDVNGDNLLDVVYEGSHVSEGEDLVFYINTGDSLKIALKVYGYAETMTFKNNRLIAMQCIVVPCCCSYGFFRDYYSFTKPNLHDTKLTNGQDPLNSMYFSKLLNCKLIAMEALEYFVLPPNNNLNEEFIAPRSFYLTTNPKPLFNKGNPGFVDCSYGMEDNSNQIGLFGANSKGAILARYTSNKGKSYTFIKINNKYSLHSIFGIRNCYIYGWTETENLNK